MNDDWDYNTWRTADLKSLLAEIKGILEERENERKKDREKEVPLARTYKDDIADHYAQTLRESKRMEMELRIFGSIEENK
tara:strand:- start:2149 stop:2388 length:240 start_codon:yes stop_codon:yes gene_type:complete